MLIFKRVSLAEEKLLEETSKYFLGFRHCKTCRNGEFDKDYWEARFPGMEWRKGKTLAAAILGAFLTLLVFRIKRESDVENN